MSDENIQTMVQGVIKKNKEYIGLREKLSVILENIRGEAGAEEVAEEVADKKEYHGLLEKVDYNIDHLVDIIFIYYNTTDPRNSLTASWKEITQKFDDLEKETILYRLRNNPIPVSDSCFDLSAKFFTHGSEDINPLVHEEEGLDPLRETP